MKLSHGFRSRFELEFAQHLAKNKIKYEYEKYKFRYIVPIKNYTPDALCRGVVSYKWLKKKK